MISRYRLNIWRQEKGFTIVELMIATLVFSVILLVAAGTVVRFTSNFQKGVTQTATQNAARSTVDLISQQLQFIGDGNGFSKLSLPSGGITKGYCIQGTQYSYILGRELQDQVPYVLVEKRGTGDNCTGQPQDLLSGSVSGSELLSPHMRLAKFTVINDADPNDAADGSNNPLLYKINIKVVYGDDDLLCVSGVTDGSARDCSSGQPLANVSSLSESDLGKLQCKTQRGSQFCAVSELSTTVQRRV